MVPGAVHAALGRLCEHEDTPLFVTLLAAFDTLLYRYTDQADVIVGSSLAGKILPLRTDLSGNPTFLDALARVRGVVSDAKAHQGVELQPLDAPVRVLFDMRTASDSSSTSTAATRRARSAGPHATGIDAYFCVDEGSDHLRVTVDYDRDSFDHAAMVRVLGHFQTLLAAIVAQPAQRLSRFPIVTEAERHQLLVEWNDTATDYPRQRCIHELIEAQVEKTPRAVAVTLDDTHITYDELNRRANRVAGQLRRMGVGPDVRVGLCVDRSIDMVVGVLGILKAGGGYVPLDPQYPVDHLRLVLHDAQVSVIVSQRHVMTRMAPAWPHGIPVLAIDDAPTQDAETNLVSGARPESLAYVIYTSGSSGGPKGVMIAHQNLVHSTSARLTFYRGGVDGFLLLPSFAFDASVAVIFWTLCTGGRLVLPSPGAEHDPSALCRLIVREGVSHLLCVCSTYAHILERAAPLELASIRVAIVGGEACPTSVLGHHREKAPHASLFNEYGSTECTVWSSVCEVSSLPENAVVPIGRPIPNSQVYILDTELQPVPVGMAGEIYIGGDGVARGYLNRPDLTTERFIPNPFSHDSGSRLYKTGDLARYRTDGNIVFLGRSDRQVKIHGCRIEPDEIETALAQHPSVRSAVVVAVNDSHGDDRLVAYLAARADEMPTAKDLRGFLRLKLPDFMIPAHFVFLDSLPMTPTGKVDRRALPFPIGGSSRLLKDTEPLQPLELRLKDVWEEVLNVRPIGLDDDFFDLGGDSLRAVELLSKIGALTNTPRHLPSLLEASTIRQLVVALRQTPRSATRLSLVPVQRHGSRPTFFCINYVGGSAIGFLPLARRLGPDQPFYSLEATALDAGNLPDYRIEEIAAVYLREIRTARPNGPYFLGGYCFGGLIAFEIARQLKAEGQSVLLLALFDTVNPGYVSSLSRMERCEYRALQAREKIRFHWKTLVSASHRLAYAREAAESAASYLTSRLSHLIEKLPLVRKPALRLLRDEDDANSIAYRQYVPRAYPGLVTVFRADESGAGVLPPMGWERVAGSIATYDVPGDHTTMLKEPHVRMLAERLKTCLDRSQQEA